MIRRIDLFLHAESKYDVLDQFTLGLKAALEQEGVECRFHKVHPLHLGPFIRHLLEDPPDATLCFNGLFPDESGLFLSDEIGIPHVACTVDAAFYFSPLAQSSQTMVTCVDRFACRFMEGLGAKKVFFMPHAVDRDVEEGKESNRKYDVTMFSSCHDYRFVQKEWQNKYPAPLAKVLDEAAEIALSPTDLSYAEALVERIDGPVREGRIDPEDFNFDEILLALETYVKGRDRVELIKAMDGCEVHLFGEAREGNITWKDLLGSSKPHLITHPPVSFLEAIQIMQQSKIVLNSCLWIKDGLHERIVTAQAAGALVVTNENPYTREFYTHRENILYYQPSNWGDVNPWIHHYLQHPDERKNVAKEGRKVVLNNHTWNHRARALLSWLNT